jgi:histidinol dehydrogenase
MLGIPALLAGCKEVMLATPPSRQGNIHPTILYAADVCGITRIYKAGGAQGIAALAYGTESLPRVDKIFGPGNSWVNTAKLLVQMEGTSIDMPAGPSEVMIASDSSADPCYIAADLLSQAEHGPDSQVILLTDDPELPKAVRRELERQLPALPRKDIALQSLKAGFAAVLKTRHQIIDWINHYAPEHLILSLRDAESVLEQVQHAGSVFLGHYSPESLGDYASGTNHTLPTGGSARSYSGITLDSFRKCMMVQRISPQGLAALGPHVEVMARAEGLSAHQKAVSIRAKQVRNRTKSLDPDLLSPRPSILRLTPYICARDEFEPEEALLLDANENSLGSPLGGKDHRYPDPRQTLLKTKLGSELGIDQDQIFIGNGSDEAIDLLIRAYCEPARDAIIIQPPTYGMYRVAATVNNVRVLEVPLKPDFSIDLEALLTRISAARITFFCSPNNPTGNLLNSESTLRCAKMSPGLVVVDEAYIDFADQSGMLEYLCAAPNLIILRTFSKAWGLAGMRIGMALGDKRVIAIMNKIKYPYNVSRAAQTAASMVLQKRKDWADQTRHVIRLREQLAVALGELPCVEKVFPSQANFLLVRVKQVAALHSFLKSGGIAVRDRSRELYCDECLRITVGSPRENETLLTALKEYDHG